MRAKTLTGTTTRENLYTAPLSSGASVTLRSQWDFTGVPIPTARDHGLADNAGAPSDAVPIGVVVEEATNAHEPTRKWAYDGSR
jgi:hypothetical protein